MTFAIQLKTNEMIQTNVYGSVSLNECVSLTQEQIVDLIWSRAAIQCFQWLIYVNRTDIDMSSLNGTVYTPKEMTIVQRSSNPMQIYTPPQPLS